MCTELYCLIKPNLSLSKEDQNPLTVLDPNTDQVCASFGGNVRALGSHVYITLECVHNMVTFWGDRWSSLRHHLAKK